MWVEIWHGIRLRSDRGIGPGKHTFTYTQCFHEEATRHANIHVCLQELPNLFIICLQLLPKDRWEVLIIVLTNHGNCHSAICFPSSQSGWITFVSCSRLYNARHCHRLPWTSLALTFQFPAVSPVLLFPFQDGVNKGGGIFCVLWISYMCYSCQDWINLQNWTSLQANAFSHWYTSRRKLLVSKPENLRPAWSRERLSVWTSISWRPLHLKMVGN